MSVSLPVEGPGDAELISAVRGGDVDAYGELFARHVDSARRLARQLAGSGDADDLVSDAFTKVLTVLQRGGGPDLAFRAYLLTAVRRLHVDKIRAGSRLRPVDDLTPFDPGLPFQDTAVEGFENAAAAKAFASLPERWQMVLWHTEVEQQKPADIAPLLGMSANSVSALAYRAREGLRQAFLSQHATDPDDVDCAWTRDHLGAYIRSGLSRRDAARVDDHLASCRACAAVYLELTEVNSGLAGILAPLLLGSAGAGYVSSGGTGSGLLSNGFTAAKTWATAHASLTAIGGMLVTATAVASIYGAAHLHSRDAADLGSPPPLHGTSATNLPGQNGHHHGHHGHGGRNHSKGPGSTGSSAPGSGQTTPGVLPSSGATSPATGPTTGPTGPTDTTSPSGGPTDTSSGPTSPTSGPTGPTGGSVKFTSTPPANPAFGDTYRLHASGGSGNQIVFSIGGATTHAACSLDDAGTTVTFDHAGRCVIRAQETGNNRSATGASRSATDAVQRVEVPQESQRISFTPPSDAAVGGSDTLEATSSSGLPVSFALDPQATDGACIVSGSTITFVHALPCSVVAQQAGDHDYRPASEVSKTFDVGRGVQTIAFTTTPGDAVVGGDSYAVAATSSSGDPVTLGVDDSATTNDACSLDGDTVSFQHHGTCAITAADLTGNADYLPASNQQSFDVGKGTQTITFTTPAPDDAVVDGTPYPVAATSSSGDPVTFAVDDSATTNNACEVTDAGVVFHHHGTCAITASDSDGNADYLPASNQQSFDVGKGTQTITFTTQAPADAVVDGTPYAVAATSSSGDLVTFSLGDATTNNACEVTDFGVVFHHAGTCAITASDSDGNADYLPASSQQSFDVGKGSQTITFTTEEPDNAVVDGTPYAVAATSSSGDPVTFGVDDSATTNDACEVTDAGVVFHHAGTCAITATQQGDDDYDAAPPVTQIFGVGRGTQIISFTTQAPDDAVVDGTPYAVAATSSSGDPVSFTVGDATTNNACEVTDAGVVFHHAGTCAITASDSNGNADYLPASSQQSFDVGKGTQTVSFTTRAPDDAVVDGTPYAVAATSSSGDPVSFTVGDATTNNACEVTDHGVVFHHAGTCAITATATGDADYLPASTQQQFLVGKGTQAVSFTTQPPGNAVVDGTPYAVAATSSSGDPVSFTVGDATTNNACEVTDHGVVFHHHGTCAITATTAGDADYLPASTQQQFLVGKGSQTITFTSTPPNAPSFGDTYAVSATGGSSGNPVTFSSTTPAVCSVSGTKVTFAHAGDCVVAADQKGNDDYTAASETTQTIHVPQVAQSITFTTTPPSPASVKTTYHVAATGGASGNPVVFGSNSPQVCTVSGSTVSFLAEGTCVITATQQGNGDYQEATATQSVTVVAGPHDLTLSVTTEHGWLFGVFGTIVNVQVTGLTPGAHATLTMSSNSSLVWSDSACDGNRTDATCAVSSTPTSFGFLALALSNHASLTFTVSSTDSQDSDPGDNTVTVPISN